MKIDNVLRRPVVPQASNIIGLGEINKRPRPFEMCMCVKMSMNVYVCFSCASMCVCVYVRAYDN